ncbi:MAG: S1 RNA-binding domain-containing protein [Gemmataceae bacterium]|nr:S1 RNA-binding domain-containing protein [Gemmataceae bacterium]MDW8263802.1 S1 RNA-binding domain-containing protein [Gemmataceae bacterium]
MSDSDNREPMPSATPEPSPGPPAEPPRPRRERSKPRAKPEPIAPRLADEPFAVHAPKLRELDQEIEQELSATLQGISANDFFTAPARPPAAPAVQGGRKKGKVLRVHGADVFVEVPGGRSCGVLPLDQFPEGPPALGTEVEISIEGYDEANGLLILTRRGAAVHADWSTVAVGMVVEARVTATNKGGLEVDVNGLRGFMPISQIDIFRVETPEQYLNERLRCLVVEVNPKERNLVVSRRALLEKEREEQREQFWREVQEGQVREGTVRTVKDFGAFVDLGGADGLIHVSEMSWGRVRDATEVLQPGQRVKVAVLKVDREARKLSLGLKQLTPSPWDNIIDKYPFHSIVTGKVSRITDFGAFVELEPGVEGLIHISELAPQRVRRVTDVVQLEQEVQAMVLDIDVASRRIALSLKAAAARMAAEAEEEPEETTEEEVPVKPPKPRTYELRGGLGDRAEPSPLSGLSRPLPGESVP